MISFAERVGSQAICLNQLIHLYLPLILTDSLNVQLRDREWIRLGFITFYQSTNGIGNSFAFLDSNVGLRLTRYQS
jgi:hypothetical protein